jgi:hypothetical protein
MSDKLYLIIAQYFRTTKKKVIVHNDPKLVNSPYSNIRVKETEEYYDTERTFIDNLSERTQKNETSVELSLVDRNKIETPQALLAVIKRATNHYKEFTREKIFNWRKPVVFKIKFHDATTTVFECTSRFNHRDALKFEERLRQLFFDKKASSETKHLSKGIIYIQWDDVEFANKRLHIKYKEKRYWIECENATMELQGLKRLLFRKSNLGLEIDMSTPPFKVVNAELLQNVIKYLSVHYRLTNSILDIPNFEFRAYLKELKSIQSSVITQLFKDEYIAALMDYHCMDFPLLPVLELNNQQEEPSLIFTLERKNKVFLVWENKSHGRATYIFTATLESYVRTCQNLYDFIRAELKRKRIGLIDYEKQLKEKGIALNYEAKVIHSNLEAWRSSFLEQLW